MSDQDNQREPLLANTNPNSDEELEELERLKKLRQINQNQVIPDNIYGLSQEIISTIDLPTKQRLWQEAADAARNNTIFRRPKFEEDNATVELNEITNLLKEKLAANPSIKLDGEEAMQILHSNCEDAVYAMYDTIQRDPRLLTNEAVLAVRDFVNNQNNIDYLAQNHANELTTKRDLVGSFLANATKAIAKERLGRDFEIQRAFGSRGQADIEIANSFEKEATKELNQNQKQEIHFRNNVLKEFYYQENARQTLEEKAKKQQVSQAQFQQEEPLTNQTPENSSKAPAKPKARNSFFKILGKIFSPILRLFGFKSSKKIISQTEEKNKESKKISSKTSDKILSKEEQNRKLFGNLLRNSISPNLKANSVDAVMTVRLVEATAAILEARNPGKYSSFSNANEEALDLVLKYTSDNHIANFLNEHNEQSKQTNRSSDFELEQRGTIIALEILGRDILTKATSLEIDQNAPKNSDLNKRQNELRGDIARLEQEAKITAPEAGFWDKFSDQIKSFVTTQNNSQKNSNQHQASQSIQNIIGEHDRGESHHENNTQR